MSCLEVEKVKEKYLEPNCQIEYDLLIRTFISTMILVIPVEVEEFVEKHIVLMISQTETYLPFIKVAFPDANNVADGVYAIVIIGSALSVFVNLFAMRMKYPTAEDFADFGKISLIYRDQVDQCFKVIKPVRIMNSIICNYNSSVFWNMA